MARTTIPESQLSTSVQDKLNDKYTKAESDSKYATKAESDNKYVDVAGDTVTGEVIMTAPITQEQSLITKEYADTNYAKNEPKRMTSLYELGYDDYAFDTYTTMEEMLYDIGETVVEQYGSAVDGTGLGVTIQIDQYSDATHMPMIYNLFKANVDADPFWYEMIWGSTMMRLEIQDPSMEAGGLYNVTFFMATDMRIYRNTSFRMNDGAFSGIWINQDSKVGEGKIILWEGMTNTADIPIPYRFQDFDFITYDTTWWGGLSVPVDRNSPLYSKITPAIIGSDSVELSMSWKFTYPTLFAKFADSQMYTYKKSHPTNQPAIIDSSVQLLAIYGGWNS